jgi:hypothetical protein
MINVPGHRSTSAYARRDEWTIRRANRCRNCTRASTTDDHAERHLANTIKFDMGEKEMCVGAAIQRMKETFWNFTILTQETTQRRCILRFTGVYLGLSGNAIKMIKKTQG